MPQALGPDGFLRFQSGLAADGPYVLLPLITTGSGDVPEATSSERQYVNPALNPPQQNTTPAGPGSYSFTYDKNAAVAVMELQRRFGKDTALLYQWFSQLPKAVTIKAGTPAAKMEATAEAGTTASVATFTLAKDLLGLLSAGHFLVSGAKAYVVDKVLSSTTANIFLVGAVNGGIVEAPSDYAKVGAIGTAAEVTAWVPAEIKEFSAEVSQFGGTTIGTEAQEDTVALALRSKAATKYAVNMAGLPTFGDKAY